MRTSLTNTSDLALKISDSFPKELNVYSQAHLELTKTDTVNSKLMSTSFQLSGMIQGHANCYLAGKLIAQTNDSYLQSLFTESMNILVGRVLTNLESKFALNITMSSPINDTNISHIRGGALSKKYIFTAFQQELECYVDIYIKKP